MGDDDTLKLEKADGVAILTLLRPHCLNIAGKQIIAETLESLIDDQQLRALIVAANNPAAFLVDVAELADMSQGEALAFSQSGHRVADALAALPFPVIAAVSGQALGGGCEFVMSCDLAYAAEGAQLGQIEALGGVIPGFGGTWRLAEHVGAQRSREMIFTGAVLDAASAKAAGLVLEVVPDAELVAHCRNVADRIAATSRGSVAAAKQVFVASAGLTPAQASALEQSAFVSLFESADQRSRMHAVVEHTRASATS
ncbi:enoyl-CoA hydratase/isomerase family protein [Mycobacterium sp.]|uniref:enoyl-CoA hydratase/isomerase family protein n=1 Tax=Mycobacterium sp. TaxID=1785 RepID=UPI003D14A5DE